jgi:hypothetical protein
MRKIEDYILLDREDRRKHLDLSAPCIERGGESKQFRGLLAHCLDTTIPKGFRIYLCHACNNGDCSNPAHLYWGTPRDNHLDQIESGTYKTFNERIIAKHGEAEAKKMFAKRGLKNKGKTGRKYTPEQIAHNLTVIRSIEKKFGWKSRAAEALGISHTQVIRFIKLHGQ